MRQSGLDALEDLERRILAAEEENAQFRAILSKRDKVATLMRDKKISLFLTGFLFQALSLPLLEAVLGSPSTPYLTLWQGIGLILIHCSFLLMADGLKIRKTPILGALASVLVAMLSLLAGMPVSVAILARYALIITGGFLLFHLVKKIL